MKVIIDQDFEGYPDAPDRPGRHFKAGAEPIEVPDAFGKMIVAKGHAHAAPADVAAAPVPAVEHKSP
jgi:hypothetical protein